MNEEQRRRIMALELATKMVELADRTGVKAADLARIILTAAKQVDDYIRGKEQS